MIKIAIAILIIYLIYKIERIIYYNRKFKEDSKYPCFVVISQDGFISKPIHYEEAKAYSDKIYGVIKVDREEYNRLKSINNEQ
jgi:hypothetical protein